MNEDLRTWFRQKWVRMDTKGKIKGPCAREDGEGKPKCLPAAKAKSMSKQDRATAARRKRREDPVADRKGKGNKPVMVKTEEFIPEGNEPTNPALWSKAKAMAKKKFDVYPSAYANGWAAKYYKSKGGGWRSVSEESTDEAANPAQQAAIAIAMKKAGKKPKSMKEACWKGYKRVGMKKKGDRMVPNCVPEATDIIAKAKLKLATEGAKYPREGFPKEGDYGYHPNPGLKPQESDQDEDMDVAYKKATEKEGRKPLNAQTIEVSNKVEEGWVVKKGTEVVSIHKTKDEADVKAMKHPLYKVYAKEEVEIEEAYGMWKVDFPKQHAGKAVAAGSVHVKAQNTAHAHKVAAKRVGVDHKMFKSKVTKSSILPEEDDMPWHEDPKNPTRKSGERKDEYGNKIKNVAKHLAKKAMKANVKEELGKDNEWGRPELRKKFAAMTPGQEGLTADKIPSFDPRYDDVTTQYCGGIKEGYLAEISAKGAEARAKFQAKVQKVLADPARIAKAKKAIAKKKQIEKEKEPPHLVMQLRKAISVGSKVHFRNGEHHQVPSSHADRFISKYNSAKTAIEKEALQKRAHASHSEFMKTIAEEVHENCGTPDCCQMCDTAETGTHHVDSYEAHRGSGDQISPVISHDDEDIRFADYDEAEMEKELEADVLALKWDDIVDLYDDDEVEYVENPELEEDDDAEEIEEAITPAGRLKKKFNAMRTKSRRMMARNIAIKRVSTPEKIKSRSIRTARRMVYKRLLRNRDMSTVSAAEKSRLEAQVKRMAPMVARLSVRVMPQVRKLEQSRIKNSRTRKK